MVPKMGMNHLSMHLKFTYLCGPINNFILESVTGIHMNLKPSRFIYRLAASGN